MNNNHTRTKPVLFGAPFFQETFLIVVIQRSRLCCCQLCLHPTHDFKGTFFYSGRTRTNRLLLQKSGGVLFFLGFPFCALYYMPPIIFLSLVLKRTTLVFIELNTLQRVEGVTFNLLCNCNTLLVFTLMPQLLRGDFVVFLTRENNRF